PCEVLNLQGRCDDSRRYPGFAAISVALADAHRGAVIGNIAYEVGGAVQRVNAPAKTAGVRWLGTGVFFSGQLIVGTGSQDGCTDGFFRSTVEVRYPVAGRGLVREVELRFIAAAEHLSAGCSSPAGNQYQRIMSYCTFHF